MTNRMQGTNMKGTKVATSHTIDATNRTIGRVASEAAHALMGKRSVHFVKNQAMPVKVVITNAAKMHLPLRRVKGKIYNRYTGHPGGFFETRMDVMIEKKGIAAVLTKTIDGMIPRNKLRTPRMKNLTVTA
jgi:large subunit ribosomal protein L13